MMDMPIYMLPVLVFIDHGTEREQDAVIIDLGHNRGGRTEAFVTSLNGI
jgi:hypothetical protein